MNSAKEFFLTHLPEDMTITAAATLLNVRHPSMRQWLRRKRIAADKFEAVAQLLGVSISELEAAGFERARRHSYVYARVANLMPLVENIAASRLETLSGDEFNYLMQMQLKFSKTMTPGLVRELLAMR